MGVVATLVHLGVAWTARRSFGLAAVPANTTGYLAAFALSYLGHFYWTFGRTTGHHTHLPRFLGVSMTSLVASNLIVIVVDALGGPFELALLGVLVVVPLCTWAASRLWAFADHDEAAETAS